MRGLEPYLVATLTASATLVVRFIINRIMHSGNVRMSDADTIFKASESVRNDIAVELAACRKERDHYLELLNKCLEGKQHA